MELMFMDILDNGGEMLFTSQLNKALTTLNIHCSYLGERSTMAAPFFVDTSE
jgi:hypothetical protein